MKVGIVDYRMGNLASVSKAVEAVGHQAEISSESSKLAACDAIVVPGVGNFGAGARNLSEAHLDSFVIEWAESGRLLLGICLGMQLFFERSEEADSKGLGILEGEVVRLPSGVKVPHMGWNTIVATPGGSMSPADGRSFYFVHSYWCVARTDYIEATVSYGISFPAAVRAGRIVGLQFHPEKSGSDGIALLSSILGDAA